MLSKIQPQNKKSCLHLKQDISNRLNIHMLQYSPNISAETAPTESFPTDEQHSRCEKVELHSLQLQ